MKSKKARLFTKKLYAWVMSAIMVLSQIPMTTVFADEVVHEDHVHLADGTVVQLVTEDDTAAIDEVTEGNNEEIPTEPEVTEEETEQTGSDESNTGEGNESNTGDDVLSGDGEDTGSEDIGSEDETIVDTPVVDEPVDGEGAPSEGTEGIDGADPVDTQEYQDIQAEIDRILETYSIDKDMTKEDIERIARNFGCWVEWKEASE